MSRRGTGRIQAANPYRIQVQTKVRYQWLVAVRATTTKCMAGARVRAGTLKQNNLIWGKGGRKFSTKEIR